MNIELLAVLLCLMSDGIFNVTTLGCGGQVANIHLYIIRLRLMHAIIFYGV